MAIHRFSLVIQFSGISVIFQASISNRLFFRQGRHVVGYFHDFLTVRPIRGFRNAPGRRLGRVRLFHFLPIDFVKNWTMTRKSSGLTFRPSFIRIGTISLTRSPAGHSGSRYSRIVPKDISPRKSAGLEKPAWRCRAARAKYFPAFSRWVYTFRKTPVTYPHSSAIHR